MPLQSSQLFDESMVQGVRLTLTDGTIATFYGPAQINTTLASKQEIDIVDVEIFYPRHMPDGAEWQPVLTKEES